MKHVVIGTAGHIDHGKTVLTRALTGVDTDRLPEEKEREMSIDLGFAPFPLSKDLTASIVDVPGHERFIKNMVAGVSGVDLILFVVAADDGIKPQTEEHLQILELLGLHHGIIVITKRDLVSPDRVRLVVGEIRELARDTFLENAPVVEVSATETTGIPELKAAVHETAKSISPRRFDHLLRLPIDRVFMMAGFGVVVTGTLISGSIKTGQELEILPQRKKARVRAIQVHRTAVDRAVAGQRTAVNLKDIGKHQLQRGDVITSPGTLETTTLVDVKLGLLDTVRKPLKHLTRVRFHVGTTEIMARVALLQLKELPPGDNTFAQIRFEKPAVALRKDRFIIRSYSPQRTIGGGMILNGYPVSHRRNERGVIEDLSTLESPEDRTVIECMLRINSSLLTKNQLMRLTNISSAELDNNLAALGKEGNIVFVRNNILHTTILEAWTQDLKNKIDTVFGDRVYISKGEFMQSIPSSKDMAAAEAVLKRLETEGIIELKAEKVKLLQGISRLTESKSEIEAIYKESTYEPPSLDEVKAQLGIKEMWVNDLISALVEDGNLVKVGAGMAFHRTMVDQSIQLLRNHLTSHPGITVSEFRQLLGTTRKYALPLLEYFDSIGITVRDGDIRRLKKDAGVRS